MLYLTVAKLHKSDLCLKETNPTEGKRRGALKPLEESQQDAECTCLCMPEQGDGALLPFPRASFEVVCVNQQGTVLFRKEQDFPFT